MKWRLLRPYGWAVQDPHLADRVDRLERLLALVYNEGVGHWTYNRRVRAVLCEIADERREAGDV